MKFPQDFIEKVREANNLVDIIGQQVQLRRTGGNYQGLCPFHHEKSPSFSVSEEKQVYHCFGCKKSGNVFRFVQDMQGLTFPETIEYLARRAAIPLPESREAGGGGDPKQTLYRVNALAASFYQDALAKLPADHEVKRYLETRQLSDEVVKQYKLGYAPADWSELARLFESKRVPTKAAEELGLIKKRPNGNGHYDFFRHRLMFPIFSPAGQCIGFGGRVLTKEDKPKYLNSTESPLFHKGRVFYGLDHSAKYVRAEDECIVVEGYMDWLALAKVSINNIVATLGTALTVEHAKAIKRYTNKVVLLFDGDAAGKNAASKSLPVLLKEGLFVRGLFLPEEYDPDEFIAEKGEPALRQLISGAPDLFDLVASETWMQHRGSPTGKVQVLDELAPVLAEAADPRLRQLYITSLANRLDIEPRLVAQSVARTKPGADQTTRVINPISRIVPKANAPAPPAAPPGEPVEAPAPATFELMKVPRAELEILNLILMKEVFLKEALESGVGDMITHLGARSLFARIAQLYGQMPSKFDMLSASLTNEVNPAEAITRHLGEAYTSLPNDALTKLLQDCIKRVKENHFRTKSKELVKGLRGVGPADSAEQLEQIMNVQKSRRSLNRDS